MLGYKTISFGKAKELGLNPSWVVPREQSMVPHGTSPVVLIDRNWIEIGPIPESAKYLNETGLENYWGVNQINIKGSKYFNFYYIGDHRVVLDKDGFLLPLDEYLEARNNARALHPCWTESEKKLYNILLYQAGYNDYQEEIARSYKLYRLGAYKKSELGRRIKRANQVWNPKKNAAKDIIDALARTRVASASSPSKQKSAVRDYLVACQAEAY